MPGDADRDRPAPLAAVLAGGSGSRLGGAKAGAELAGWPLISYPLAALAKAGIETFVVAKADFCLPAVFSGPDGDGSRPPRVLREPEHPRHPLCGIVAALREAGGRPLVVIACDMPLAEPALLAELAAAPEPLVVPAPGGRLQPLQARYSAGLLPSLEAALDREEPLRRTVESLSPRLLGDSELARFGDPEHLFFNVNDEFDLRRADGILGR
jgi:molybdopterin-guanine dinucleotide biosynthesis protein A